MAERRNLKREDVIAHILGEVASGRPVSTILSEDEGMPSKSEFWRWHMTDETLRGNLADARANGIEALMEDARHVACTPMVGEIVTEEPLMVNGQEVATIRKVRTEDMLGHRKLVVETIIKQAQMLKPKTYGPKLDLTTAGEKLNNDISETDRAMRGAALLSRVGRNDDQPS